MWVHALADATPACGGKAMGLSTLIRAGLPVPDGFAIEDAAFRAVVGDLAVDASAIGHVAEQAIARLSMAELPAQLLAEIEPRAIAIGPQLVVRSSATIEDRDAGSAAGVFTSTRAIPQNLVGAIKSVWSSALTPLAAAYARRQGGTIAIGVIVQRFAPGPAITIYTRPPGKPEAESAIVQRGDELRTVPRSDPSIALALRAEVAIGASTGADVELAGDHVVQARPIVHPPPFAPRVPVPPVLLAALVADGRVWTWDVGHNPDPLSPAQAALVERVDRAGVTPYALRVAGGYLYTASRPDAHAVPAPTELAAIEQKLAAALGVSRRDDGAGAWAWHDTPAEAPPLDEALARYVAFCGIYASEMTPLVAAARRAPPPASPSTPFPFERVGVLSPAWDVAVPTYGERPGMLDVSLMRAFARVTTVTEAMASPFPGLMNNLTERDDIWFARAQLLVRRAILARADELGVDRDDAFWIPLDQLVDGNPLDPDEVRRTASAHRAAAERASRWEMPLVVGGPPPHVGESLRGVGSGPRVVGRVVRFATLGSTVTVGHGDIVVARAVTPALAVQVVGCAALVSETGGLLDHGAALARELGITCVVGCRDAWSRLSDGMIVIVDGEQGSVEISEPRT